MIRDPRTFCFNFDCPKDVDDNLKHKTEFNIQINESLPENKIKNVTEQLLLKNKHGNNIDEYRKKQNDINLFLTCHKD